MIRVRGRRGFPNFDISLYDVQVILDSTTFPIKGASKTIKRSSIYNVLQKIRKTRNFPSSTPSAPPSLHPIDQTQTTAIDSSLQYQFHSLRVKEDATRPHGLAALKLWGESASLNFPLSNYLNDLEEMKSFTKKEYFLHIRKKTGLTKTVSDYRGVSRNAHNKKWQVRLGKGKDIDSIYVGTFDTEEQAAEAYDVAAIRVKGPKAITNFDKSNYDIKQILEGPKFLIEKGASKTLKRSSVDDVLQKRRKTRSVSSSTPSAPPSLHPIDQTKLTAIDSTLQYQFQIPSLQVPVPHGYQNPTFEANRSFSPHYDYGGSEPTTQFQPIIPVLNQEFPSHQYYNGNSQHHLDQTPSSQFLQDTQNPNLVAGLNNLASDNCMEDFSSSQVHEASFEMMGTNEGGVHGDGNLVDPVFGLGNSDLDSASWLETFLRMSPQRPDSKV
ncbi:AP2-like ethylene-responsive transcription factor PLT2 [Rosa rugosa]|uniref:AP2-like ethylene-responsive transcription factor PLT2 n=1 Tax=Rosa rugosa TaxID=74645 RepID=UPI002B40AE43|nr:AP2-like ethylene-responsive transcription factor PLT2 [Rosa rugosa]